MCDKCDKFEHKISLYRRMGDNARNHGHFLVARAVRLKLSREIRNRERHLMYDHKSP